jgi:predicted RNA binding protein YcfA (HicA-like mRNA interferase family)
LKLPTASGRDLVKVALKLGFELRRQKGSHAILRKNEKLLVIPVHGNKSLKTGTLLQILKVLEIDREKLKELL